ncbi:uncharacterized protein LOC124892086 [Capsicum annuum]|uniref:uncharacterized protein LOC124892086 n=1 Tax=Capsicum annuum TaxID=4072 RepID=UPI001FB10720|nr:uncharacterized protein LOC124892086 [Capsicum annuum]
MEDSHDALWNDMDAMKGHMTRIKAGVDRLCPPNPSQVQIPQVQRSYTSQNPMSPLHKLESEENEAKPQDGEKLKGEIQKEYEKKREKEKEAVGSDVRMEEKCLIVDLVHKESLLLTNPNTSILPSILPSHVQVQDPRCPKEKPKEVPFKPLAESPYLGTSDEEVNPKGNPDLFPCNVGHEGCHDVKPSEENTSHDLQDVNLGTNSVQDGEDDTSMRSTKSTRPFTRNQVKELRGLQAMFTKLEACDCFMSSPIGVYMLKCEEEL